MLTVAEVFAGPARRGRLNDARASGVPTFDERLTKAAARPLP
jgi:hypothetical protein